MKEEIKEKWINALKSGKYEQGRGRLRKNDKYCCLGVLCDLYARETDRPWIFSSTGEAEYLLHWADLPPSVAEWAGFPVKSGLEETCSIQRPLALLNDEKRQSFKEIADYIERIL